MKCSDCGFDPDLEDSALHTGLKEHGYEIGFYRFDFGPEGGGTVRLCPCCGNTVERDEPESYAFSWVNSEIESPDDSLGGAVWPPYLQPQGEPGTCSNCEELVQPSEIEVYDTDGEGVTHIFCSRDCHETWHEEFYEP
ncbi:hypothetical protein ACOZ4I_17310 (plasmid) [Haloarcula salina]|uniref:hypothetical protein n=1 Tax=Haloarcula salina TaxID=1429914 RepID=UPI003C6FA8A9